MYEGRCGKALGVAISDELDEKGTRSPGYKFTDVKEPRCRTDEKDRDVSPMKSEAKDGDPAYMFVGATYGGRGLGKALVIPGMNSDTMHCPHDNDCNDFICLSSTDDARVRVSPLESFPKVECLEGAKKDGAICPAHYDAFGEHAVSCHKADGEVLPEYDSPSPAMRAGGNGIARGEFTLSGEISPTFAGHGLSESLGKTDRTVTSHYENKERVKRKKQSLLVLAV